VGRTEENSNGWGTTGDANRERGGKQTSSDSSERAPSRCEMIDLIRLTDITRTK